jgi:hypothetical protein
MSSVVKSIGHAVSSVVGGIVDGVKSIASSPIGKIAMIVAAGAVLGPAVGALGESMGGAMGSFVSGVGTAMAAPAQALSSAFTAATGGTVTDAVSGAVNAVTDGSTAAGTAAVDGEATGVSQLTPTQMDMLGSGPTAGDSYGADNLARANTLAGSENSTALSMAKATPDSSIMYNGPGSFGYQDPSSIGGTTPDAGSAFSAAKDSQAYNAMLPNGGLTPAPENAGGSLLQGAWDTIKNGASTAYSGLSNLSNGSASLLGSAINGYGQSVMAQQKHQWELDAIARANANRSVPIVTAMPKYNLGG